MTIPTTQQLSVALERGARVAAPVVACALLLMQLAYDAGYQLGQAVHERNDQLAAAMVRLTVGVARKLLSPTQSGGGRHRTPSLQLPAAVKPDVSTPDPLRCSGFTPEATADVSTAPAAPGARVLRRPDSWTPTGTGGCSSPAAPMQHPLAMAADDLQRCLTAAQLRELTGTRAKLPKHRLAGMAVAC